MGDNRDMGGRIWIEVPLLNGADWSCSKVNMTSLAIFECPNCQSSHKHHALLVIK